MKNTRKYVHVLTMLGLALMAVFNSCHRRPLNVARRALRIELTNDYSMPYSSITGPVPYHYSVLMYDPVSGEKVYEDFCDEAGGTIHSVEGHFDVCTYDLDSPYTLLDGTDNIRTLRAYSAEADIQVRSLYASARHTLASLNTDESVENIVKGIGYEDGLVIQEPSALYFGITPGVDIPALSYSDDEFIVSVSNHYALSQGQLSLEGITHTDQIKEVQVFITNLASSKYLGTDMPDDIPATIPFYMQEISDNLVRGDFLYFGKLRDESLPNIAYIVITDLAGERYLFVRDVTSQICEQDDNVSISMYIDFDVPSHISGGSGFQPVLDEWGVMWNTIDIGQNGK